MDDDVKYTRRGFIKKSTVIGGAIGATASVGAVMGAEKLGQISSSQPVQSVTPYHDALQNTIALIDKAHQLALAEAAKEAEEGRLSTIKLAERYFDKMKYVEPRKLSKGAWEMAEATKRNEATRKHDPAGVAAAAVVVGVGGAMLGATVGDALEQAVTHTARVTEERKDKGPPQVGG